MNHQEIQRKPWRNPWWTSLTSDCETWRSGCEMWRMDSETWIVTLGGCNLQLAGRIVKLALWNLEIVLWNSAGGDCETLTPNTRLWNSEEGFWNPEIRSWNSRLGSESPCRRSTCRKQQKVSLRSPSATGRRWHLHAMSKLKKQTLLYTPKVNVN